MPVPAYAALTLASENMRLQSLHREERQRPPKWEGDGSHVIRNEGKNVGCKLPRELNVT